MQVFAITFSTPPTAIIYAYDDYNRRSISIDRITRRCEFYTLKIEACLLRGRARQGVNYDCRQVFDIRQRLRFLLAVTIVYVFWNEQISIAVFKTNSSSDWLTLH